MKYNNDTGMEPKLQNAVQELLHSLNLRLRGNSPSRQMYVAQLNGIATALHALNGEIWSVRIENGEAFFINEDETECITVE